MGSQTPAAGTAIVRGPEVVVALSLEGFSMLVWLAVILLVAWLLGWGVFHVAGGLIHLLLVIALVVFLINFITGRRTV
jgi:predicted membrane metal-binding protein